MVDTTVQTDVPHRLSLISWRSIVAGAFVAFLVYVILMSLGVGIGGLTLSNIIEDAQGGRGLSIGTGIWLILSTLIALFVGAYVASRVSIFRNRWLGVHQGIVMAGFFFAVMAFEGAMLLGAVGSGVSNAVSAGGSAVQSATGSNQFDTVVDQTLQDLNFKGDPKQAMAQIASYLVRGDTEQAKTYLSQQTGISEQEAQARVDRLQSQAQQAGSTAANVLAGLGWTLFGTLVLGTLLAALGGAAGARRNVRESLIVDDERDLPTRRAA
jgi:hypothetical protein